MLHRARDIDALLHICPAHIDCEGMSPSVGMIGSASMPEPGIKEKYRSCPRNNTLCLPIKLVFGRHFRSHLRVRQKPSCAVFDREIIKQDGSSHIRYIARYNPWA